MPLDSFRVSKALPSSTADGNNVLGRGGRYGEGAVLPYGDGLLPLVQEGSLYKAINPTPETGLAQTIQTTFSATNGILSLKNNDGAGGKHIYPLYLRLIPSVVGTSTTRTAGLIAIDNITRYSSGGSAITPVNANMDDSRSTISLVHFGALTLAAESASVRRLSRFTLLTAIMVQWSPVVILFSHQHPYFQTSQFAPIAVGPAMIGPGHALTVHLWNPGNVTTAPSWEFELAWVER